MQSLVIVFMPPVLGDDLGLEEALEDLTVEEFIAEASVEALRGAFCQGEPGSIKVVVAPLKRHQSLRAWAMNSDPWSQRMKAGVPHWATSRSSTAQRWSASMERSAWVERHSRVNSSMMLRNVSGRASSVASNWKSIAQMAFGRIAHMAPIATDPRTGRLRLR